MMLTSDIGLISDPEGLYQQIVKRYAESQVGSHGLDMRLCDSMCIIRLSHHEAGTRLLCPCCQPIVWFAVPQFLFESLSHQDVFNHDFAHAWYKVRIEVA